MFIIITLSSKSKGMYSVTLDLKKAIKDGGNEAMWCNKVRLIHKTKRLLFPLVRYISLLNISAGRLVIPK